MKYFTKLSLNISGKNEKKKMFMKFQNPTTADGCRRPRRSMVLLPLTFVQIASDEYVDVGEVGVVEHFQRVIGQENAVDGGRGRETQNAGVAVPLFLGYCAGVDGPQTRHGAHRVAGQLRRVALAVVQQLLGDAHRPFAGHVAPGRVHRSRLDDAAFHQASGLR